MADGVAEKTASKTGSFFQKHKTTIFIVGGIVIAGILFIIVRGSSGSSSSAGTASNDPGSSNGLSQADLAGLLSSIPQGPPGMAGAAGATGAKGATGARGKTGAKGAPGKPAPKPKPKKPPVHKKPPPRRATPQTNLASRTTHYTVKPGETTASVAAKHGMDSSSLFAANRTVMGSSAQVHAGQRVQVH